MGKIVIKVLLDKKFIDGHIFAILQEERRATGRDSSPGAEVQQESVEIHPDFSVIFTDQHRLRCSDDTKAIEEVSPLTRVS